MSKIEKIIIDNYQEAGNLITLIQKYDFEKFLNGILSEIEIAINNSNSKRLSEVATTSLIKINENLKGISNTEKEKLEFLLSDIFQSILMSIQNPEILSEIQNTLLNACNLSGYNYEILEQMLGLKKQLVLKPRSDSKTGLPYYKWLGLDFELNDLLDFLVDKRIIISKKEFKKIFVPITEHFDYKGTKEKLCDLVLIFSILKEKCLLKSQIYSGHFSPLVKYGVDTEGDYLFKKAPNKIHEYLKRDEDQYSRRKDKYEGIINTIAKKTLRQRMDNDQSPLKL